MTQGVEQSLEIAAERCPDLAPLVYARLFARFPHVAAMFCLDTDGAVRGSMLAHAVRVLLDVVGERHFGPSFINAESVTHASYDVPPETFAAFYAVLRDCVREVAGAAWTRAMDEDWARVLDEITGLVAVGESTARADIGTPNPLSP